MNVAPRRIVRMLAVLGPVLALLLLGTTVASGLHHHDRGASEHACAVCTSASSPAVSGPTAPAIAAPALLPSRPVTDCAPAHPRAAGAAARSRAPPLA